MYFHRFVIFSITFCIISLKWTKDIPRNNPTWPPISARSDNPLYKWWDFVTLIVFLILNLTKAPLEVVLDFVTITWGLREVTKKLQVEGHSLSDFNRFISYSFRASFEWLKSLQIWSLLGPNGVVQLNFKIDSCKQGQSNFNNYSAQKIRLFSFYIYCILFKWSQNYYKLTSKVAWYLLIFSSKITW